MSGGRVTHQRQHARGRVADGTIASTNDAGQRDGPVRVGDHEGSASQYVFLVIQRHDLLTVFRRTNEYRAARELVRMGRHPHLNRAVRAITGPEESQLILPPYLEDENVRL